MLKLSKRRVRGRLDVAKERGIQAMLHINVIKDQRQVIWNRAKWDIDHRGAISFAFDRAPKNDASFVAMLHKEFHAVRNEELCHMEVVEAH